MTQISPIEFDARKVVRALSDGLDDRYYQVDWEADKFGSIQAATHVVVSLKHGQGQFGHIKVQQAKIVYDQYLFGTAGFSIVPLPGSSPDLINLIVDILTQ